jgi:hypothetical protein
MVIGDYYIETDSQALCMVMRYACLTGLDVDLALEQLLLMCAKTE